MNLHGIPNKSTRWLWIYIIGGNGRPMGTHLYEIEEGEPPELTPRPPHRNVNYWMPPRYQWQPYTTAIMRLFNLGYVEPLCGRKSKSLRPRAWGGFPAGCIHCRHAAQERGIVAMTTDEATRINAPYNGLRIEMAAWRQEQLMERPPLTTATWWNDQTTTAVQFITTATTGV